MNSRFGCSPRSIFAFGIASGSVTRTFARSASSAFTTFAAGDSRVSPVSALNAKPSTATLFPVSVLNISETIRCVKRCCCHSFSFTTCSQ